MAISIDWGTKVITIPQSFLTFVSGTTYTLNLDDLRLALKDLEDDFAGMPYLDTHRHVAPIALSGVTYSRFVEIINGYTVTFEEGMYQVNLSGANNNIVDVLNRNSVSVVANNSSGLISSEQLDFSAFQNRITIDTAAGASGTAFPLGSVQTPVNNLPDALTIAQNVNINQIFFKNDYTIDSGIDVSGYELVGLSPARTTLTFASGSITTGAEIFNATVEGYLGNIAGLNNCYLLVITETSGATAAELNFVNCVFEDTVTLSAGLTGAVQLFNCKSGVPGQTTTTFDINGASVSILSRDFTGGLRLQNMTAGNSSSLDFFSGAVIFDASNTDATVVVRGLCKITNNASGNVNFTLNNEVTINSTDVENIAGAVWDKIVEDHISSGTFGEKVGKKILTTGKFIGLK
jgi:hypothetical protein